MGVEDMKRLPIRPTTQRTQQRKSPGLAWYKVQSKHDMYFLHKTATDIYTLQTGC